MNALVRYAAAIYHLGPRQAARNLFHHATRATRDFERYTRVGSGLEWTGSARTDFMAHAGGARLDGRRFTAVGRTLELGDPPNWELDAPVLWLFNLHYFAWLDALPRDQQRRLVIDWIERCPPSPSRPGWMPYPLSLRLRHWAKLSFDAGSWPPLETRARLRFDRGAGRVPRRHARVPPARQSPARERDHAQAAERLLPRPGRRALAASRRGGPRCRARRAVPARRGTHRALADVPRAARRRAPRPAERPAGGRRDAGPDRAANPRDPALRLGHAPPGR